MSNGFHSKQQSSDGIHVVTKWEFASISDRDAYSYVSTDIGGIARVGSSAPYVFYVLTGTGPTWSEVGGATGSTVSILKPDGSFLNLEASNNATATNDSITIKPFHSSAKKYQGLVYTGPIDGIGSDHTLTHEFVSWGNRSVIGNNTLAINGNGGPSGAQSVKLTSSATKFGLTNCSSRPIVGSTTAPQNNGINEGALVRVYYSVPLRAYGPNEETGGLTNPPSSETYTVRVYLAAQDSANPPNPTNKHDLAAVPSELAVIGYFETTPLYLTLTGDNPEINGSFLVAFRKNNVIVIGEPTGYVRQNTSSHNLGLTYNPVDSHIEKGSLNSAPNYDELRLVLAVTSPASPTHGYIGSDSVVWVVEQLSGF